MKKYSDYVDSSQAIWFTSIPSTWRATKIRELFSQRTEKVSDKDYPALSVGKMGVVPQLETAVKTDNGDNRKLICKGDFAINSRSDRKGSCGISQYDGSASLIITVLKPHHELNGRFYHYLLRSHYFSEEFYRNGRGLVSDLWTTRYDEMRNIFIPVPPRTEQDQIVRYLDWKVSEINRLIHGYQKQIVLLKERRTTLINNAVTKGIDPDAPIQHIEADWMGDIPAHWRMVRLASLYREVSETGSSDLPILRISIHHGISDRELDDNEYDRKVIRSVDRSGYKIVRPNDIAYNMMRAWQGGLGAATVDGMVSPAYEVARPIQKINSKYVEYLLTQTSHSKNGIVP